MLSPWHTCEGNFAFIKIKKDMKAAVMYPQGGLPEYTDVAEPTAKNPDEIVVTVKAAALKNLDRGRATGTHYSSDVPKADGRIIGGDGICLLPDGSRVYALGEGGMMAEKAVVAKDRMVPVPDGLDDATAAALPNAVIGSAMGLKFKADIQPGDVVLVNGATGVTGKVALQLAKYYGASKVIATGRNKQSLDELLALGADEVIALTGNDENFTAQLKAIHSATPIDIVIDYLWGHTAELILACLKGKGHFTNRMRYVSVGAMAGETIQLSASNLRSSNLTLTGSGLGAWPKHQVGQLFKEILPEMFNLAAAGKLKIDTVTVSLENIGDAWSMDLQGGKRLVVLV